MPIAFHLMDSEDDVCRNVPAVVIILCSPFRDTDDIKGKQLLLIILIAFHDGKFVPVSVKADSLVVICCLALHIL